MRRDYCPSRQEQARRRSAKTKRSQTHRRAPNKRQPSKRQQSKLVNLIRAVLPYLLTVAILALATVLSLFLLKRQFARGQQLDRPYYLLITKQQGPWALVELTPDAAGPRVWDMRSWPKVNAQLVGINELAESNGAQEFNEAQARQSTLAWSFYLGFIVDQVIVGDNWSWPADMQSWPNFLSSTLTEQVSFKLANYLRQPATSWQLLTADKPQQLNLANQQQWQPDFTCAIAVINTSQQAGLAQRFTALLNRASFSVVKRANQAEATASSYLLVTPAFAACTGFRSRMEQLLPQATVREQIDLLEQYRANAVVVLGEDAAELDRLFSQTLHGNF